MRRAAVQAAVSVDFASAQRVELQQPLVHHRLRIVGGDGVPPFDRDGVIGAILGQAICLGPQAQGEDRLTRSCCIGAYARGEPLRIRLGDTVEQLKIVQHHDGLVGGQGLDRDRLDQDGLEGDAGRRQPRPAAVADKFRIELAEIAECVVGGFLERLAAIDVVQIFGELPVALPPSVR